MGVDRELMRGAGPVAVLKLLDGGEKYGYELIELLSRQSNGVLAMGQSTLYPMLYNLEAQGYITARWRDSDAGRARKYYSLTGKGKKRLAKDTKEWLALADAMTAIGILTGQTPPAAEGRA